MDNVIEVNNVSKRYKITHLEMFGFNTLRDKIGGFFSHPIVLLKSLRNNKPEDFWAIKDINFSVRPGEIVGIIGGNGAGKSTLLKILSRITPPTTGRIKISGQITSLLEVGTGFHPELTGRENIFLNGAILGMPKVEIVKKFDEIVAFAGVDNFIDTPVKRYSSGMYVRLAFSVAAHMNSDILFVDEVLAVGDSEFQQKCLGKMGDMIKDKKKTILFVSHSLPVIKSLCPRSILLDHGKIIADGQTTEVIEKYLQHKERQSFVNQVGVKNKNSLVILEKARLINEVGEVSDIFDCSHKVIVNFSCKPNEINPAINGCLTIKQNDGSIILESFSNDILPNAIGSLKNDSNEFFLEIPARSLAPGNYNAYLSFFKESSRNVDSDFLIGSFELNDFSTVKSNERNGFFSTIIEWKNKNN